MNDEATKTCRWLGLLVVMSFAVLATAVVLRDGIEVTPYATTDSTGRPMGFNDPLSAQHFLIMVQNFRVRYLFHSDHFYDWILLAAHVVGFGLVTSAKALSSKATRWFFALQILIFPFAVPALLLYPFMAIGFTTSGIDREAFVDIPFIWVVSHPVWVLTSAGIFLVIGGGQWSTSVRRPRTRVGCTK